MLLALFLTAAIVADDPDQWLAVIAKELKDSVPTKRAELESTLKERKKAKIGTRGLTSFKTAAEKKRAIAEIETKLRLPQEDLAVEFTDISDSKPAVGSFGYPWMRQLRVRQVVSPTAAIVEMRRFTLAASVSDGKRVTTIPSERIAVLVWIETDTSGWTDNSTVDFPHPIVFTGTKKYDNTGGSTNTILHARTITPEHIITLKKLVLANEKTNK